MGYYLEDNPNRNGPAQYGWPRTWASGVIGVHTTESGVYPSGGDPGAENTASFISQRSDYGSYHSLADWDSRIRLTRPTFAAWADTTNNVHALSVSGAMDAARWRDLSPERAAGIVRNMGLAAAELVQDAIAHGVLAAAPPARRITAQEAIAGSRAGFYGHGETNPGTRYDPGQNFDWDLFLATYAAAVGGTVPQGTTITPLEEETFMPNLTEAEQRRILAAADMTLDTPGRAEGPRLLNSADGGYIVALLEQLSGKVGATLTKEDGGYIVGLVSALQPGAQDPSAIADAVIATLPKDLVGQLVTEIGKRLAAGVAQ